jgi:ABC-type cobalt transport system, ATPase component
VRFQVGLVFQYPEYQLFEETVYKDIAFGPSNMAVLSDTSLEVLNDKGEKVWSTSVNMNAPALAVGGDCAVAYDVGGTELYVVDGSGKRLALTADEEEPFIAATMNAKGWLAVTSGKKNYKGCVSVYDDQMNLAFAFNSSQRFVTDA